MLTGLRAAGALGSCAGAGVAEPARAYCLWIVTGLAGLNGTRRPAHVPSVTFTMQADIDIDCSKVNMQLIRASSIPQEV